MESPSLRTIEARVHGRYLVQPPGREAPWPVLVSFHGYAEDASLNLAALNGLPNAADWLLVAVQALHPFYTKREQVVASWMTRQDRELAIADNLAYVERVLDAVRAEFPIARERIVFAGFSQGGAMAYRAAANLAAAAVIVLAADVPPEINEPLRLPPVLVGRGEADEWYTADKMDGDVARLRQLAPRVETCVFAGGHQWTPPFLAAAARFLDGIGAPARVSPQRRAPADGRAIGAPPTE